MITSMSFMHLRGLAGLAKQCRNRMIKIRKLLGDLAETTVKLKKAEDEGDIEETSKELLKLLDIYFDEEENRKIIEQDEFKIELDEIKKELQDKQKLHDLLATLKDKGKAYSDLAYLLEKEEHEYEAIIKATQVSVKQVITEELDMLRNREDRLKYMRVMGDKFLAGRTFQELVDEIKKIRAEKKEQEIILRLYYKIEENLSKKDDTALAQCVNQLIEELRKEGDIRKVLFQDIANALHFIHLVYSHLLEATEERSEHGFYQIHINKLEEEGYPAAKLVAVKESYEKFRAAVKVDGRQIFKMAKWVGLELQSGDSETE